MTGELKPLIAVLDDDPDVCMLLKSWLKNISCRVKDYQQPADFLQSFKEEKPHLCIVDVNLGGPGVGFKVLQAIRGILGSFPPIVILSKDSDPRAIAHAIDIGANDYLIKPSSKAVFLEKVQQFLDAFEPDQLPLHSIPEEYVEAKILVEVAIDEVDDFGMKVRGVEILPKGSAILLRSGFFKDLFGEDVPVMGTVISNWICPNDRSAGAYIEFDPTNQRFLTQVRRWIRDQENANRRIE